MPYFHFWTEQIPSSGPFPLRPPELGPWHAPLSVLGELGSTLKLLSSVSTCPKTFPRAQGSVSNPSLSLSH